MEKLLPKQDLLKVVLNSRKMTSMNDSPTCSKEVLQALLTVFLSQSWSLNSIDIKSAFLHSKEINRQVF